MSKKDNLNEEKSNGKIVELPALDFFKINLISFLVPLYVCLGLFLIFEYLIIIPFKIPLYIHFLLLPGFLLLLYYVYLIILIEISAFWVRRWNKKSPPTQGIFKRILDNPKSEEGNLIKYYHKRGFIIKYPMWLTSKSPFPWLLNRALRKIGHNKLGKNAIYCDAYAGLEFTQLDDNVFIYPTSGLSSHAVNTIFGKLSILEVRLSKNTTFYPGIIAGPGVKTNENYVIYPNTVLHKNWRGTQKKLFYQGSPGKAIDDEIIK